MVIDYSVNLFSILTPAILLCIIAYCIKKWINGTGATQKEHSQCIAALQEEKVGRTEFENACADFRGDIKELRQDVSVFRKEVYPVVTFIDSFRQDLLKNIKSNARLLGEGE